MKIHTDGQGQPYIQWHVCNEYQVRAWVQRKIGEDDWARTGRYLNVARCNDVTGNPNGNPTVFPIFTTTPDDAQVLLGFAHAVCAVTGSKLLEKADA